jgi:hypothetical protein
VLRRPDACGETLSNTEQVVPGGLVAGEPEESEQNKLTATLELVGSVTLSRANLAAGKGTALGMPVRVHLKNEFLGSSCYVGSSSSPIVLDLTNGTTSPPGGHASLTGKPGERESKDEGDLVIYKNDVLVENAFSVPGAKGCGGVEESLYDSIVDEKFDLPSSAGTSSVVFAGNSEFASAEAVRASE